MAENFDLIFGQSASSQYEWNDSDYQNGWGTVGSTPPTAEQFDALQRRNDKKAQELNSALTPLVNQSTASNRQPLTAYALKDIRYYNGLPVGWYLECSTAGTSGSGDITLPTPLVENATITDGTVVWTIRKVASTSDIPAPVDISGKANVDLSNLTDAGLAKILGNSSLSNNGYQVLGSGLIVQWGTSDSYAISSGGGGGSITFPISFTTNSYIVMTQRLDAQATTSTIVVGSHYKDRFAYWDTDSTGGSNVIMWMAIGV